MKISKDAQRTARKLMEASLIDGILDLGRVKLMVEKIEEQKPRGYLAIAHAYLRLVRLEVEKNRATIESAIELDGPMRQQVETDLKKKYGPQITTEFSVNPELIGGMRIRVGSDVWDGSVANRIERLSEQF